jgi:hypothetical protein
VGLVTAMEMIVLQGESKSVSPFCSRWLFLKLYF